MKNSSAFNDVLSSLKVSGMCLLVDEYTAPWAIAIPDGKTLGLDISPKPDTRVIAFHLVQRGSFTLQTNETSVLVEEGEVIICTGSQNHLMVNGKTDNIVAFYDLLENRTDPAPSKGFENDLDSTALICGVFMLGNCQNNPLIDALPTLIHVDISGRNGNQTLYLLGQLLQSQLSQNQINRESENFMTARVLEMLCAEAIKEYMASIGKAGAGWFTGLTDDKIGAALNLIHARPDANITVGYLAQSVGMSASRFAARFRQTLGTSPMNYTTRWRMNIASRLLIETNLNTQTIAEKVGYESPPAFTRAFSKHYNHPPARWRRQQQSENQTHNSP